jgi:hypothetical protein
VRLALKELDRVQPSGTSGVDTDDVKRRPMKMSDEDIIVKIDRHIEVVTTETTAMKETGFGSVETCQRVCDVLKSRYAQVHFNEVQSERDLERIVDREPDLVVLCVKYVVDEERTEQRLNSTPTKARQKTLSWRRVWRRRSFSSHTQECS